MNRPDLTQEIKKRALEIGFDIVGIAAAEPVAKDISDKYSQWMAEGCHPQLSYMFRNHEKRTNPTQLFEPARSVIMVGISYYCLSCVDPAGYRISSYALGQDYHLLMKDKLKQLQLFLSEQQEQQSGIFCDTAPLLERYWGWKAGLGWIGKNNQLIVPSKGSFFFLGAILTDLILEADQPLKENCKESCRLCLEACPSKALSRPFFLDCHKCLSYWTIENKAEIPDHISLLMKDYIYGCDECLKACPHNKKPLVTKEPALLPNPTLLKMKQEDWDALTESQFNRIFENSPILRIGYQRWMRNKEALLMSNHLQKITPK